MRVLEHTMSVTRRQPLSLFAVLAIAACVTTAASARTPHGSANAPAATILGTWTGSSTCVGNRPACKNEEVVYRFVVVDGQPRRVTLLADKVIEGERVPMGKLEFIVSGAGDSLSCDFRIRQTHGIWAFKVAGDTMVGTLVILPDRTLGRRVRVHRVREDQVPKAPPLDEYAAVEPSPGRGWEPAERAVVPDAKPLRVVRD